MKASIIAFAILSTPVLAVPVYDYVVVGDGTAGLTIANRLTEDPDITVAVLEAGLNAEDLPEVFIPGFIGMGISYTTLNWSIVLIGIRDGPQSNLNNRTLTVNAGKALGGSSVINAMIFSRGQKEQYDAWGQLNDDSTWTWSSLLPFFKKSELFTPPNGFQTASGVRFMTSVHGFAGLVKVGFPNFFFTQSELWRKAAEGLGFHASSDLTNGDTHAVGIAPDSIDAANNTRCSAACAYYTPFASRPNLILITNATVSRILWAEFNGDANSMLTASGVEYILNEQTQTVDVSKEVILSAGAIGSPKILELSGVGNSTILKAAGVTPVLNLPTVGENFADHVHSWANAFTNITLTNDALRLNPAFAAEQKALWFENRTGLYSAVPRSLGIAAPSDVFPPGQLNALLADAQRNLTHFAEQFSNGNPGLAKGIAAQHLIALALYQRNEELPLEMNAEPGYSGPTSFAARPARNYTTVNSVLYVPLSRGRSHIVSADPITPPAVDPAHWAHPLDVAIQVGGIKLARRMLLAPPLDSIYDGEFEPGVDKDTDTKIEEWLRGVVTSDNHEVGSLSMMPQSLGGVVDTKLRIYGTENVRVADASIIPFPLNAHLSSTVYMIGERAADLIRGLV